MKQVRTLYLEPGSLPQWGDLWILDNEEAQGQELNKRRPHLIVSPVSFQKQTGLALAFPTTHKTAPSPVRVPLPDDLEQVRGSVVLTQLKTLDFRARNGYFVEAIGDSGFIYELWFRLFTLLLPPDVRSKVTPFRNRMLQILKGE